MFSPSLIIIKKVNAEKEKKEEKNIYILKWIYICDICWRNFWSKSKMSNRIFSFFFQFFPLELFFTFQSLLTSPARNFVPLKSITIKFIISMMKRSIKISDDKWRLHIKMVSLKLFLRAIKYPFYDIISSSFHPVLPNYFVFNICKCVSDD